MHKLGKPLRGEKEFAQSIAGQLGQVGVEMVEQPNVTSEEVPRIYSYTVNGKKIGELSVWSMTKTFMTNADTEINVNLFLKGRGKVFEFKGHAEGINFPNAAAVRAFNSANIFGQQNVPEPVP